MSTPASFPQVSKLFELLGRPSAERMQYLLSNGDLLKLIVEAGPGLSQVDRAAFRALLSPRTIPSIDLTPVDQYARKLRLWNNQFKLGLRAEHIDRVASALPDHAGPLLPTSITLTLGNGLQYDWEVGMNILTYELLRLGVTFMSHFEASRLSYFTDSEPKTPKLELGVALLDLQTFWDRQKGTVPRQVREQFTGKSLPGLEVVWFLALNPQVFLAMDGSTVPYLWAAGLVVDSGHLPDFGRAPGLMYVDHNGMNSQWDDASVVVFREC